MSDDAFEQEMQAGITAYAAERPDIAVGHFQVALGMRPDHAVALYNLGIALDDIGLRDAALPVLLSAHHQRPDHAHTLYRLGMLLAALGRADDALALLARLVIRHPHYPDAAFQVGNVLMALGRPEQAEGAYRMALVLTPDAASVANNLGAAIMTQADPGRAAGWYGRAVQLAPKVPEFHKNLGVSLIAAGDFRQGWPHYDWRDRQTAWGWKRDSGAIPRWDGSPLAGRTILVHAEQGLGDTLQFIRYLPLLRQAGARTLFECQPTLRDILTWVAGIDQLICQGTTPPRADCHVPLMSLPGLCGSTPTSIPGGAGPYLRPPPDLVANWAKRVGGHGFRIGINWQAAGPDRCIPLAAFACLTTIPGVRLFNLQQCVGLEQLQALAGHMGITCFPDAEQNRTFGSFVDSAAIIANLDLVISCDSAMIHLAGAMGHPAFLVLPWLADWRWMQDRDRTPWYTSVRMFRAPARGDWAGAMTAVAQAVAELIRVGAKDQ